MEHDFLTIADEARVEALIEDLARRIDAHYERDEFALVGILRRGGPIARRIAAHFEGRDIDCGELRLERYSDDLETLYEEPRLEEETLDLDVEGRDVLLVDDVLYTGRTLFRAASYAAGLGARSIRCVTLCSRGVQELPIRSSFVGLQLDVGEGMIVDVDIPPYEDEVGIVLRERPEDED